jgi:hypothetical protein
MFFSNKVNLILYFIQKIKESEEHLELLEGLVTDLLQKKWHSYIKNKFYFEIGFFLLYFALAMATIILKRLYFDYLEGVANCTEVIDTYIAITERCKCAYLYPEDPVRIVRYIFEIVLFIYTIVYLVIIGVEFYIQNIKLYTETLLFNPSKVFFIVSLISYLLILPMRLTCMHEGEDYLIVISIIFKSVYILYLGRYKSDCFFLIFKCIPKYFNFKEVFVWLQHSSL